MTTAIQINTNRLILKEPDLDDASNMVAFLNKNKFFHKSFEPIRSEEYYTKNFWDEKICTVKKEYGNINGSLQLCILKEQMPHEIIGVIYFQNTVRGAFQACHLGYMLDENEQGNGYMAEALEAAVGFMFEKRNFHRIMANYMVDNIKSEKILTQLGFAKEGIAKDYLRINGQWRDHILTSIVNSNWKEDEHS